MRRPTIIDVAKLAGVSKATVARVVNGNNQIVREETRQRVQQAIDQLGYERNAIASSLRRDQTFMVALCIPDITNPFWPEVARGVQDSIEASGYTTVLVNSDWNTQREANYLRVVRRNRFDGLVINPTGVTNHDLNKLGIPVVILGNGAMYPDFDSVGSNTEQGSQDALRHLYMQGHRKIGLIIGVSARNKPHARRHSYIQFHIQHHLSLDESLIIECGFSDTAGYSAMQQLMQQEHPPSAVFTANDILAIGALKAARASGLRVPEDVSIMGMDDIHAAATTSPGLTTINKPKYEIGALAGQYLLERLSNKSPASTRHTLLPCHVIKRGSTAAIT